MGKRATIGKRDAGLLRRAAIVVLRGDDLPEGPEGVDVLARRALKMASLGSGGRIVAPLASLADIRRLAENVVASGAALSGAGR